MSVHQPSPLPWLLDLLDVQRAVEAIDADTMRRSTPSYTRMRGNARAALHNAIIQILSQMRERTLNCCDGRHWKEP